MITIVKEKVKLGWNFEKIFIFLCELDEHQKINKDKNSSNELFH